ncbi:MAG: winged helix-turn-helix transcriptional regulator, partial [Phycisphaeraceae bacterium]|nr:winged helix-turn-helix transcriptional regulator [Phycisphaeraceae bacterium]
MDIIPRQSHRIKPDGSTLASELRELARSLGVGARFPTVRALMSQYGVSQSIVAQALQTLQRQNILESTVGRGTFVSRMAPLWTVLWVCGIDLYHGDISPFYTQSLRFAKAACNRLGWGLDSAWLSNFRPGESAPYCTPEILDHYTGFIFSGCAPDHRFMHYVMSGNAAFVDMTYYASPSRYCVATDMPHMLRTGMAHLKSRGHPHVTLMTTYSDWLQREIDAASGATGMTIEPLNCRWQHWTTQTLRQSYDRMLEHLKIHGLPRS